MQEEALQRNQQQVKAIHDHLLAVRRNMEALISENNQLRDALSQSSQQLESLKQENATMQLRDEHHETRRVQLGQCVDDALAQVDQVLSQIVSDDDEEEVV